MSAGFTTIHMSDGSIVELPNSLTGRPVNRIDLFQGSEHDGDDFVANRFQKIVVKNAALAPPGTQLPIPRLPSGQSGAANTGNAKAQGGGVEDNHVVLRPGAKVPKYVCNQGSDFYFDFGAGDAANTHPPSPIRARKAPPPVVESNAASSASSDAAEMAKKDGEVPEEVAIQGTPWPLNLITNLWGHGK